LEGRGQIEKKIESDQRKGRKEIKTQDDRRKEGNEDN
jgi:hypothetical protein